MWQCEFKQLKGLVKIKMYNNKQFTEVKSILKDMQKLITKFGHLNAVMIMILSQFFRFKLICINLEHLLVLESLV